MAFSFSPKIATDGLVLYLDAANHRSYPGSGTTWFDLSKSRNDRALVNGPTYSSANGGSIQFDGLDDYTTITIPTDIGTIDFWWYYTQGSSSKLIMGGANSMIYAGGAPGVWHWYNMTGDYGFGGDFGNRTQWLNMTAIYTSNTNNSVYINGQLAYSSTTYNIIKNSTYNIAGNMYSPHNMRVATVRVYNRALSATEILQNYNAHKSRYGLT